MQQFVTFNLGKSVRVFGTVHQNGFQIGNKTYRFFETSQFLYGSVLFLDIQENKGILPLLPITNLSLSQKTEKNYTTEIIEKIELYVRIFEDTKKMISNPENLDVKLKLERYKTALDSNEYIYFTQEQKTYKKIRDLPVYVNFGGNLEKIIGKIDSGATISVIRNLPADAVKNRVVSVRSTDTTAAGPKPEQSYIIRVNINNRQCEIEAIVRPDLSHQILLPLSVLGQAGIDLNSLTEEVELD